ncbi:hypothetical protein B3286c2_0018 [Brucella vulpis]|nr:hypothetical protein BF3285c2_0018 [Brucella vulpis]CUW51042.1 hypothetical protein B3286c2_0018 [Brucella vulpis]
MTLPEVCQQSGQRQAAALPCRRNDRRSSQYSPWQVTQSRGSKLPRSPWHQRGAGQRQSMPCVFAHSIKTPAAASCLHYQPFDDLINRLIKCQAESSGSLTGNDRHKSGPPQHQANVYLPTILVISNFNASFTNNTAKSRHSACESPKTYKRQPIQYLSQFSEITENTARLLCLAFSVHGVIVIPLGGGSTAPAHLDRCGAVSFLSYS